MTEVKIKQDKIERVITLKKITMKDQQEFFEFASKSKETEEPLQYLKYLEDLVLKYTDLSREEFNELETTEGNKLVGTIINALKPYTPNKDF